MAEEKTNKERFGSLRKIDRLGRVTIPSGLRRLCDLHPMDDVVISVLGDVIEIRKYEFQTKDWMELMKDVMQTASETTSAKFFVITEDIILTAGIRSEDAWWKTIVKEVMMDKRLSDTFDFNESKRLQYRGMLFYLMQINENMKLLIQTDLTVPVPVHYKFVFNVSLMLLRNIVQGRDKILSSDYDVEMF